MGYNKTMQDSIFTKISNGEIPGEIIYQDDTCFVILSIEPFTDGHMLVIPYEQIDHLWDLDEKTYHHLFDVAKKMQTIIKRAYPEYPRIGMLVEGFGVPHAHVHVYGYKYPLEKTVVDHVEWKKTADSPFAAADQLRAVAEKLRAA
ncbi:MAG: histidine triad family protein [Patescibacteria group bacterium]|nr:histidine triad family protein [Patescibacteria group bacterium]